MVVIVATICTAAVVVVGCQSEPVAPQLPVGYQLPPVAPVAPVVAPVPEPVAPALPEPPPTPLTPIVEETPVKEPGKAVGTGICKNIPGIVTNGDEVVGNYMCKLDTNDLPMGITPPPFGCALRKGGDGSVSMVPMGREAAAIRGPVTETKAAGFRLDGTWSFMNNKLRIGACMMRKGAGKFQGSGSGILNDKKDKKVKFTLTMTAQ
jgi:hypothetical protein